MSDDSEFQQIVVQLTDEERAYQAYTLRIAGHDWSAIASRVGYDSATVANRKVKHLIDKAHKAVTDDRRMEIVELELARLDALQAAVWDSALSGDVRSVDSALKVMMHRARLLQLGEESQAATSRTIIITSDEYVEQLKEIAKE